MEYSMILLDNSDWSRNGDYIPSRWEAQVDSAFLISNNKLSANQESAVGIITLAGQQPQVLLTPTNEDMKIQACLYGVKLQGKLNFKNGLAIAYLALKHRKNSYARQRITVFVASPVEEDEATLVKFAKTLKKNSVAVDLINIGEMDQSHVSKLQKFIETVNQGDNSHFISIAPGLGRMEDQLTGTAFVGAENPMMAREGEVSQVSNQFAEWGGINPQEDPELAEIMRQSLLTNAEEERRRQAELQKNSQDQQQTQQMEVEEQKSNKKDENLEEELIKRAENITIDERKKDEEEESLLEQEQSGIADKQFMNDLLDMIPGINKDDKNIQDALKDKKDSQQGGDKKPDEDKDKKQ